MSKTATFITSLPSSKAMQKLYRLDPPLDEHEYVVVSATIAAFFGPETFIFPSDKNGVVTDYGELDGSYSGDLDHEKALKYAGYEVV